MQVKSFEKDNGGEKVEGIQMKLPSTVLQCLQPLKVDALAPANWTALSSACKVRGCGRGKGAMESLRRWGSPCSSMHVALLPWPEVPGTSTSFEFASLSDRKWNTKPPQSLGQGILAVFTTKHRIVICYAR